MASALFNAVVQTLESAKNTFPVVVQNITKAASSPVTITVVESNAQKLRKNSAQKDILSLCPEDVMIVILSFLNTASIVSACSTSAAHRVLMLTSETILFRSHLPQKSLQHHPNPSLLGVLTEMLLHSEIELRQLKNTEHLAGILNTMPSSEICGIGSNIGKFEDPAVALAVSSRSQKALGAVVVGSTECAIKFRRLTKFAGPATFVSIRREESAAHIFKTMAMETEALCRSAPGYIGLAYKLLELRSEEEGLRETALLCIYRNLSVWHTEEQMHAHSAKIRHTYGRVLAKRALHSVALDSFNKDGISAESTAEYAAQTGEMPDGHPIDLCVAFGTSFRSIAGLNKQKLAQVVQRQQDRRDRLQHSIACIVYGR